MSNFARTLRQTLTIARRDFIATVFTPTFLLFLLAPVFMLGFGAVGGLGAASMAKSAEGKVRIVAVVPDADRDALIAADRELRGLFRGDEMPPPLFFERPGADPDIQARALFQNPHFDATAALYGTLERPQILFAPPSERHARYLAQLAEQALRSTRLGSPRLVQARVEPVARQVTSSSGHGQAAFFTVFGLFMLSLMLSSQAVGTMAEERSNKVIEVLAAATPLESVFLGKLLGMFGVALMFLLFWGSVFTQIGRLLPGNIATELADVAPATGAVFPLLFFAYFTMSYMLLGAVFLSVGAQAATPREIQMLSLPITIFQMGMLGFAIAAASQPGSWVARAAEIFPFSSPFAMGARAANQPEVWPHLLALGWQVLWVAITVTIGARLFRRGVLKSGGPKFRLKALFGG
ncbi:MAG: ABC transporter permease [Sphingomonas sp.]|uniref:ABC transporter permease n=1 Tax=Sphingomonas sp. TaxID=28214 RepID=UPI001B1EA318|nr:ABC transporter permease [Sphingomonas sp.]MBO9624245.1 ABC transporter permease [Sphingomonas sp.]